MPPPSPLHEHPHTRTALCRHRPLLDSAGRLVGLNTAIFTPSGTSAGVGFAIPVATIARVVPQLISSGRITRPGLGVTVRGASVQRCKEPAASSRCPPAI